MCEITGLFLIINFAILGAILHRIYTVDIVQLQVTQEQNKTEEDY